MRLTKLFKDLGYSIHKIELPTIFEMKTVNSYIVKGDSVTVIDCGERSDECWAAMIKGLADLNLTVSDIDEILITHAHVDHMGMAKKLSDESGAKVKVSDLVYDWAIHLEREWDTRTEVMKQAFTDLLTKEQATHFFAILNSWFGNLHKYWDAMSENQVERFDYKGLVNIGGYDFQSIHAPGHSYTQTCFFYEQSGDFISADMLLPITPTCVIETNPKTKKGRNKSMLELLNSYNLLRKMDIQKMYPGHYTIKETHKELIDRQVNRIMMRKDYVLELIETGHNQFMTLFNALYDRKMNFPGLVMTIGYLDLLEHEGSIHSIQNDNGRVYIAH
ncbi:MAG: MBL fold metallo-hydrolase [Saprospiraceae bacterium]